MQIRESAKCMMLAPTKGKKTSQIYSTMTKCSRYFRLNKGVNKSLFDTLRTSHKYSFLAFSVRVMLSSGSSQAANARKDPSACAFRTCREKNGGASAFSSSCCASRAFSSQRNCTGRNKLPGILRKANGAAYRARCIDSSRTPSSIGY